MIAEESSSVTLLIHTIVGQKSQIVSQLQKMQNKLVVFIGFTANSKIFYTPWNSRTFKII